MAPRNTKDPHNYYKEIGVRPDASHEEIRTAVRKLLKELHPDRGGNDVDRFQLIQRIGKVLLDPEARDKYNNTPEGMRLLDAVYIETLSKIDEVNLMDEEELRQALRPQSARRSRLAYGKFDYFSQGAQSSWMSDSMTAQLWYHYLISVAPMVNYRNVIKVLLTSEQPQYHHEQSLFFIPRSWQPSSSLALSLFTVVANFRPGQQETQVRPYFGKGLPLS